MNGIHAKALLGGAGAVSIVAMVFACSSAPSQPPIETTGTGTPSQGGNANPPAGSSSSSSGGAIDDGGVSTTSDASLDGGSCNSGSCATGCCNFLTNACESGQSNTYCGISGEACVACPTGTSCTGGGCQ